MRAEAIEKCYVDTNEELQAALMKSGESIVCLQANIEVDKCLVAKGKKIIDGSGTYVIRRKIGQNKSYTGTILQGQGELLRLRSITLEGGGRNAKAPEGIQGKLVEVQKGTVILDGGTVLKENYNLSSKSNGGGGLLVSRKGQAVLKTGSRIVDNLTMSGGAGVRVEEGGVLVMEGGTIRDNAVVGQSTKEGYDGRGGGIYNSGTVILQGGTVVGNLARSYQVGGRRYGGLGAGIYNAGSLRLDGKLTVQSIYLAKNRHIEITSEWEKGNECLLGIEEYRAGVIFVRAATKSDAGWEDAFFLKKDNGYELVKRHQTLQLKKKGKKEKPHKILPTIKPVPTPFVYVPRQSPMPTKEVVRRKRKVPKNKEKQMSVPFSTPSIYAVTPETALIETVSLLETEEVKMITAGEVKGHALFVQDATKSNLMEKSIWRQSDYAKLLEDTFQKDSSAYEQVWDISAKDMGDMRRVAEEHEGEALQERCRTFLEIFQEGRVNG